MQTNTFEGSLYRGDAIIREDYAKHHRNITNTIELRSALRAGQFACPGGYALFAVTSDGAVLCFQCVRAEYRQIADAVRTNHDTGWLVVGIDSIEHSDEEAQLVCDNCGCDLSTI